MKVSTHLQNEFDTGYQQPTQDYQMNSGYLPEPLKTTAISNTSAAGR